MAACWSQHSRWAWAWSCAAGSSVSASQGLVGLSGCCPVSPVSKHVIKSTSTTIVIAIVTIIITGLGGGGGAGSALLSSTGCTPDKLSWVVLHLKCSMNFIFNFVLWSYCFSSIKEFWWCYCYLLLLKSKADAGLSWRRWRWRLPWRSWRRRRRRDGITCCCSSSPSVQFWIKCRIWFKSLPLVPFWFKYRLLSEWVAPLALCLWCKYLQFEAPTTLLHPT